MCAVQILEESEASLKHLETEGKRYIVHYSVGESVPDEVNGLSLAD